METAADHRALIERIRAAGESLRQAVQSVPASRHRTAPRAGEWSVLETLVHLRDVVVMIYGLRMRRLVYETNPVFGDYDEARYRTAAMARNPTAEQLVGMIVAEHQQIAGILAELPDAEWGRTGRHPELGEMSIQFLARRVAEHADEHAGQIRDIDAALRK
jgi:hypothetical protein